MKVIYTIWDLHMKKISPVQNAIVGQISDGFVSNAFIVSKTQENNADFSKTNEVSGYNVQDNTFTTI